MALADPLIEAIRSLVLRVLNDSDRLDFRALYPGRVVSQDGAGGAVDFSFDEARLKSKSGVPLAPVPGHTLALAPGTRVLLGWLGGDERFPRVFPAHDGAGGLTSIAVQATLSAALVAPAVNLGQDPGASAVMLASAIPAQATMFAAMAAANTASATAWSAVATAMTTLGQAGAATAATAAATAESNSSLAIGTYAGQASGFAATRVRAT